MYSNTQPNHTQNVSQPPALSLHPQKNQLGPGVIRSSAFLSCLTLSILLPPPQVIRTTGFCPSLTGLSKVGRSPGHGGVGQNSRDTHPLALYHHEFLINFPSIFSYTVQLMQRNNRKLILETFCLNFEGKDFCTYKIQKVCLIFGGKENEGPHDVL